MSGRTIVSDPYEHDARPVVSLVLDSGSFQGRLVAADAVAITIENSEGDPKRVASSAVRRLVPLASPDPRVWGRRRPAGPAGREVIHGAEG